MVKRIKIIPPPLPRKPPPEKPDELLKKQKLGAEELPKKDFLPLEIPRPTPSAPPEEPVELLKRQKNDGEELLKKGFLSLGEVQQWNAHTKDLLTRVFGPDSHFIDSVLYAGEQQVYSMYEPESLLEKQRRKNFQTSLRMVEICIEEFELNKDSSKPDIIERAESKIASEGQKVFIVRRPDESKKEPELSKEPSTPDMNKRMESMETSESRKVFIVHGNDEEKKEAVAKLLTKMELEPVILHEQPSQAITLIEKFEHDSDVVFAIIILTGDDCGYPEGKPEESKPRPRQNVVFELGFLIGRLQGQRVCALHEDGLELPSDYQGAVFIPYDAGGIWKLLIARAMKTANIEVDLNRAI